MADRYRYQYSTWPIDDVAAGCTDRYQRQNFAGRKLSQAESDSQPDLARTFIHHNGRHKLQFAKLQPCWRVATREYIPPSFQGSPFPRSEVCRRSRRPRTQDCRSPQGKPSRSPEISIHRLDVRFRRDALLAGTLVGRKLAPRGAARCPRPSCRSLLPTTRVALRLKEANTQIPVESVRLVIQAIDNAAKFCSAFK